MVQWSKAGLIILPVWFESWKLLSFAKIIQKVYGGWKVFFVLVMAEWIDVGIFSFSHCFMPIYLMIYFTMGSIPH